MSEQSTSDPRLAEILELIMRLAAGDLEARAEVTGPGDDFDAVITGLNMLAEEFSARHIARLEVERRIDEMLEVLLALARLDFSRTAPISAEEDQLDVLAMGLNMLGEELQSAHERSDHLNRVLRAIRNVNQLIVEEKNRDQLIRAACSLLVETRGYRRAGVSLQPCSSGPAVFAEAGGAGESLAEPMAQPTWPACLRTALSRSEVLIIDRGSAMCAECPVAGACSLREGMLTRIAHEATAYGVLAVDTRVDFAVDEEEQGLFQEVASDIGLALHNIGVEEKRRAAEEQLRRAHQELRESTAQLVHSERLAALGELAAGVAHELNQPLNGIKIIAQKLLRYRETLEPGDLEEGLREVLDLVRSMAEIISHMGLFARRSEGTTMTSVDVNTLVRAALRLVGQQIRDHGIELVENLDPELPEITGDPVRLQQVILNLITNARDSLDDCDRDGRRVQVSTHVVQADGRDRGESVALEVKDNGNGIPAEAQRRIFEPFFTTKAPGAGTGLGLSIAAKIMAEHGGSIEVRSTAGEETVFTVTLPVHPRHPSDHARSSWTGGY